MFIHLPTVKWFQVLLYITENSIKHPSFCLHTVIYIYIYIYIYGLKKKELSPL